MIPTPDGVRYLHLGDGDPVPRPFHLRWLVPFVCRRVPARWFGVTVGAWMLATVCVGLLAPTWQTGVAAALLFCWLPGIRYGLRAPILVDLPALALALVAAVCVKHGEVEVAIVVAMLAGACKESAPVFAAAFAWNPWLLVGLVAPAIRAVWVKPCPPADDPLKRWQTATPMEEHEWILAHPWRAGWKHHQSKWLDGMWMIAPWGATVVAAAAMDWQLATVLALGYGQLLVASDTVRLYQWAAPVVCIAAVSVVPVAWLPVLVVATIWNPLAGDGV